MRAVSIPLTMHLAGELSVSFDEATDAWLFRLECTDLDSEASFAFLYRPDMQADMEALRLAALAATPPLAAW